MNLFHEVIRERKRRPLRIQNGGCFETLNLLHVSSCEMFTLGDVKKKKIKKRKQTLKSAQYRREIIFNSALS